MKESTNILLSFSVVEISDVDPLWSYADMDPHNFMNADPEPVISLLD